MIDTRYTINPREPVHKIWFSEANQDRARANAHKTVKKKKFCSICSAGPYNLSQLRWHRKEAHKL